MRYSTISLSVDSFAELFDRLQKYKICIGNPDSHFVPLCETRQGKLTSIKQEVVAFLDNVDSRNKTVRRTSCELLMKGDRCATCHAYISRLRAMYSSAQ